MELFFDSCDEMKSWMQEKDAVLSDGDMGRDLETVRALQRRHQVNKQNRLVANKITYHGFLSEDPDCNSAVTFVKSHRRQLLLIT